MTVKFRALLALAALLGVSAAHIPRASAASNFFHQCWYRPGIDSPSDCYICAEECLGPEYICCIFSVEEPQ